MWEANSKSEVHDVLVASFRWQVLSLPQKHGPIAIIIMSGEEQEYFGEKEKNLQEANLPSDVRSSRQPAIEDCVELDKPCSLVV